MFPAFHHRLEFWEQEKHDRRPTVWWSHSGTQWAGRRRPAQRSDAVHHSDLSSPSHTLEPRDLAVRWYLKEGTSIVCILSSTSTWLQGAVIQAWLNNHISHSFSFWIKRRTHGDKVMLGCWPTMVEVLYTDWAQSCQQHNKTKAFQPNDRWCFSFRGNSISLAHSTVPN